MKKAVTFVQNSILLSVLIFCSFLLTPSKNKLVAKSASPKKNSVITVTDNFKQVVTESHKPVVVLFSADWCPTCKAMDPIYQDVAKTPSLAGKIKFVKMDIDQEQAIEYGIDRVPTFIFFKNGQPIETIPYGMDKEELQHHIAAFLKDNR